MMPSFQVRSLTPGVLFDFGQGRETILAFGGSRRDHPAHFTSSGSFAGFVTEGAAKIETPANNLELPAGAYFAARGRCIVSGGAGFIIEIPGYPSIPELSGEVKYHRHLAGGRSVMLVPPGVRGGPSLSTVHLLAGTVFELPALATPHAGLVAAGAGICGHEQGATILRQGQAFMAAGLRCFYQACWAHSVTLILYEPSRPPESGPAEVLQTPREEQPDRRVRLLWEA